MYREYLANAIHETIRSHHMRYVIYSKNLEIKDVGSFLLFHGVAFLN